MVVTSTRPVGKAVCGDPRLLEALRRRVSEASGGRGAMMRNAGFGKSGQVLSAEALPHAVEQQGHLGVVGDDPNGFQQQQQIGQPLGFVLRAVAQHRND